MSEVTAEEGLTAVIKLASVGASKFTITSADRLLKKATENTSSPMFFMLAMAGASTKEEVALVREVLSAIKDS